METKHDKSTVAQVATGKAKPGSTSSNDLPQTTTSSMGTGPNTEIEFKLAVAPALASKVTAALERRGSLTTTLLHAHYFDTVDDLLAADGLVLRLRQENGRWSQTLKHTGAHGNLQRPEHEVELSPADGAMPGIDLWLHAGTEPGRAAFKALGLTGVTKTETTLVKRYGTRIVRQAVQVHRGGSCIEMAFDQGHVEAGNRSTPISELELELEQGQVADVVRVAKRWVRQGLWLLAESKSDRGLRLLRELPGAGVVKADAPLLAPRLSADALARAVVLCCLRQILPNAAALAEGSRNEDHVHQLRIGLRRLRTALRELKDLSGELPQKIERPIGEAFRLLGAYRDQETVLEAIKPQLLAAGANGVAWADADGPSEVDLAAIVRAPAFQLALLDAAGYALAPAEGPMRGEKGLRKRLRPRLRRLHRELVSSGERFKKLPEDEQHDVRKAVKRLRYLSEFIEPLYAPQSVQNYLEALRPAQDALGHHNDGILARSLATKTSKTDDDARFAVKWLTREQRRTARKAHKKLHKMIEAPRFWQANPASKSLASEQP